MATLAAVLFIVAYNMGEWREIPDILRLDVTEILVWLMTFALTVVADLTVAVEVGMALAALLYIYRVSQTTVVSVVDNDYIERGRPHILQDKKVPDYVSIVRIQGPFLFGTTDRLAEETADVSRFAPIVVLRLRNMTAIDATGLHALEQLADRLKKSGRTLLLCGAFPQPRKMLARVEFVEHVGENNILPHVNAALRRAEELYRRRRPA
jgi:SulP family sulfate permease